MSAGLQADVVSLAGLEFAAIVRDAARRFPAGRPEAAIALLDGWDGGMELDSAPAALYQLASLEIFERTAGNRMSKPLRGFVLGLGATQLSPDGPFAGRLSAGIVGVARAAVASGAPGLLWESLAAAHDSLAGSQGAAADRWGLRTLKRFTLSHPLAGAVGSLAPILNRGPFSTPGDADSVRVGAVSVAPGGMGRLTSAFYRAVYDLGEPHRSGWSAVPGQSGHPASPHYADGVEDWLQARLQPLAFGQAGPGGPALVLRKP